MADIEVMLKNVKVIDEDELSNENIHIGSKNRSKRHLKWENYRKGI